MLHLGLGRNEEDYQAVVRVAVVLSVDLHGLLCLVDPAVIVFLDQSHLGVLQSPLNYLLGTDDKSFVVLVLTLFLLAFGEIAIQ